MKVIQIKLAGTNRQEVHDGLGGIHKEGDLVKLPDETADILVGAKLAIFVDGNSELKVHQQSKERADQERLALQKRRSEQAMKLHENLPPEVRLASQENPEAVEDYLADLTAKFQAAIPRDANADQIEGADVVSGLPSKKGKKK